MLRLACVRVEATQRRFLLHPDLHSHFARERLRQDHGTPDTDADGTASVASESVALRASRTEDAAAVHGELVPLLDGTPEHEHVPHRRAA